MGRTLSECWTFNQNELDKQWKLWDQNGGFKRAIDTGRRALIERFGLRAADIASPVSEVHAAAIAAGTVDCDFEFVTKSGLVKVHRGWIRATIPVNGFATFAASIDGSIPDNLEHDYTIRNLVEFHWPFGCSFRELSAKDGTLVLVKCDYPSFGMLPDESNLELPRSAGGNGVK